MAEGIEPTVGQRYGGTWNEIEQQLQSLPFAGQNITRARNQALAQANEATINKVTDVLGVPRPKQLTGTRIGPEAVDDAHQAVSAAYDDALGAVKKFNVGASYTKGKATALDPALPEDSLKTVTRAINRYDEIVQSGKPRDVKRVIEEINRDLPKYRQKDAFVADALTEYKNGVHAQIADDNPRAAALLRKADEAFSKLVVVENAQNRTSREIFSPSQLKNAIRATDRSARKNLSARGQAAMSQWGDDLVRSLGPTVSDSGTAGRAAAISTIMNMSNWPKAAALTAVNLLPTRLNLEFADYLARQPGAREEALKIFLRSSGATAAGKKGKD
jgi:hypothetical protein